MASNEIELTVKVNAETGQLEIVNQKLAQTSESAKKVGSSFKGLSNEASSLLKSMLPFATAAGIVKFFSDSVKGAEEENEALRRLKNGLEASGVSWKDNEKKVNEWGSAIQAQTRFSDTEAFKAIDKLVRITGNLSQAQKASQLAMGLSVSSGKDLAATTELVTNLLNGNTRGLMEAKKEFGNFVGGARSAQEALDALDGKFGDAAFKEESLTKNTALMKNAFGEFQDTIGRALIPGITTLVGWLKNAILYVDKFATGLAGAGAMALAVITNIFAAIKAVATGNFKQLSNIWRQFGDEIKGIVMENAAQQQAIEETAHQNKVAKIEEQTRLIAQKGKDEIAADAKRAAEVEEANKRLEELEADLQMKMQDLAQNTFDKRMKLLELEEQAEIRRIENTKAARTNKDKAITSTQDLYTKKRTNETETEAKINQEKAMETAAISVEALQTINSMSELRTRNDARRAKMLLALEQAIAIARIWSSQATGNVIADMAIKAASTGLVVAQFAAQSQAIDRAQRQSEQQSSTMVMSNTDIGGGSTVVTTTGDIIPVGATGASTPSSGGSYVSSSGGGGGGGVYINVGGVVVNFTADQVDLSSVDVVCRRIAEAVRKGTTDAVQMAVSVARSADKNSGLAV